MAVFLDNTIYTNYALSKITRNIAGNYENFNFLKVKIGSGDNTLDADRVDLTAPLYTLRIKEVYFQDGIVTIKCEIPPELAEIPITEIGLFDTVLGVEHLFSYSKIEIVKPSDLGYELTVVLNLGPRTIKFPGINIFEVEECNYVSRQTIDDFRNMFLTVDTNLERVVYNNAQEIGYNVETVTHNKQIKLDNILRETTFTNTYYALHNMYRDTLKDLFFFGDPGFLSYQIINFANQNSYIENYLGLYNSYYDSISFNEGPIILAWNMKLEDISSEYNIFNKKKDEYLYFSVDLEINDELFKIDAIDGIETGRHYAKYSELVITIYGPDDIYTIKYMLDRFQVGKYVGSYIPYILTFNGDLKNPEVHLYIDGVEPEQYNYPSESDSKEVQDERSESDLYNKIMYGEISNMIDLPDYARRCNLRNYLIDMDTNEKYNYTTAIVVNLLLTLKKQATRHDIAFLSSMLRSLGELN